VLIRPGDVDGLVSALTALASDAALRRRLGAAARGHVVQAYGEDRLVRDIAALYEAVTRGGTG
jgi:glycosyltransferase involved in cell wall biosynthesis